MVAVRAYSEVKLERIMMFREVSVAIHSHVCGFKNNNSR